MEQLVFTLLLTLKKLNTQYNTVFSEIQIQCENSYLYFKSESIGRPRISWRTRIHFLKDLKGHFLASFRVKRTFLILVKYKCNVRNHNKYREAF